MQRIVWHFWFATGFYILTILLYAVTNALGALGATSGCAELPLTLLPATASPGCVAAWVAQGRDWVVAAMWPLLHVPAQEISAEAWQGMAYPALVLVLPYAVGITIARRFANAIGPATSPAVAMLAAPLLAVMLPLLPGRRRRVAL